MNITYISSSIVPSQKANSVHVMKMCQALGKQGDNVTLIATAGEKKEPYSFYDVDNHFRLVQTRSFKRIPRLSFLPRLIAGIQHSKDADIIYTRWLLAALFLIILRRKKVIFEYHHFATSLFNRMIEKSVTNSNCIIRHIFITELLKKDFMNKYPKMKNKDVLVLPDGADIMSSEPFFTDNKEILSCGYIGSFQKGKGVEVIIEVAKEMPLVKFHIVGGTETERKLLSEKANAENIIWHGFLNQKKAMQILGEDIDIALLPNQTNVYVGDKEKVDIGRWTSPMKLFEYMSRKKAIVASDIPVLKEILTNEANSLLVIPDSVNDWVKAIERLDMNRELFLNISERAYNDLITGYSWDIRSKKSVEGLNI